MRKKFSIRFMMLWLIVVMLIGLLTMMIRYGALLVRHYAGSLNDKEDIVALFNEGNYYQVLAMAEESLVLNPVDAISRSFAGFASYYLGLYSYEPVERARYIKDAIHHLRLALRLDAESVYIVQEHYVLALAYALLDEYYANLVVYHLEQARALGLDTIELREQLGIAYIRIGNEELGVAELLALSSDGRNSKFYATVAEAYALMGKFSEAQSEYQNALALITDDNDRDRIEMKLAKVYYDMGRLEEAKGLYRALLRKYPNDAQAYFILGKIYDEQGQPAQARSNWMQALRLDPQNSEAYARIYGQ